MKFAAVIIAAVTIITAFIIASISDNVPVSPQYPPLPAKSAAFRYPPSPTAGETVLCNCTSDLDMDGCEEEICLTGNKCDTYGKYLIISTINHKEYRYDLGDLNPWKVQTADVDGDGRKEISIGVYKTARFHPVMAKRPFIYNWDRDAGLSPKWLGSRLSRPFEDYIFSDVDNDGMDELISVELLSDGRKVINSYKWKGFGFEGIGESAGYQDICELQKQVVGEDGASKPAARVRDENKGWKFTFFDYRDGSLIEQTTADD